MFTQIMDEAESGKIGWKGLEWDVSMELYFYPTDGRKRQ